MPPVRLHCTLCVQDYSTQSELNHHNRNVHSDKFWPVVDNVTDLSRGSSSAQYESVNDEISASCYSTLVQQHGAVAARQGVSVKGLISATPRQNVQDEAVVDPHCYTLVQQHGAVAARQGVSVKGLISATPRQNVQDEAVVDPHCYTLVQQHGAVAARQGVSVKGLISATPRQNVQDEAVVDPHWYSTQQHGAGARIGLTTTKSESPTIIIGPIQRWPCNLCCRHFSTQSNLNKHLKNIHECNFSEVVNNINTSILNPAIPAVTKAQSSHIAAPIQRKCDPCGKYFNNQSNLNRHHRQVHPEISSVLGNAASASVFSEIENFQSTTITPDMVRLCEICGVKFTCQKNLNQHVKKFHPENIHLVPESSHSILGSFQCLEGCHTTYKTCSDLRQHLKDVHSVDCEVEEHTFTTKEQYTSWLALTEETTKAQYVRKSGVQRTESAEKVYLNCSRSGKSMCAESNRQRQQKSQGSSKINSYCKSQIFETHNLRDDTYNIKYYKTHYGHQMDVHHLRISQEDKMNIVTKLVQGVSHNRILEDVRGKIGVDFRRRNLITKRDINNIARAHHTNVVDGCRHSDDATSVNAWIEECQGQDDNPVIYHKHQGDISADTVLQKEDFCLIIMTKVQKEMMTKFGSNVICVDGTHGLNSYDFEMTTVLIKDEYNEGFPVAHMFSNRQDTEVYKILFRNIREHVGSIACKTFMTDITTVYYNAWVEVMGPVKDHLYCSWHVDQAWQRNLSKVKNQENRSRVYHALKALQKENDAVKFNSGLTNFIKMLDDQNETNMASYIRQHYTHNTEKWAYCHRLYREVNTNMNLESMHSIIKYHYLDGKKIKRMDKTLHTLIKFIRDKTVDRISKLTKGKNTKHSTLCYKEHVKAAESDYHVDIINQNTFTLRDKSNHYSIIFNQTEQCCQMKCRDCNICFHSFKCSCENYAIKTILCSHIHFLCLKYQLRTTHTQTQVNKDDEISLLVNNLASNNKDANLEEVEYISRLEEQTAIVLNKLHTNKHSIQSLSHALKLMKAATNILSIPANAQDTHFPESNSKNEPHNKKIDKQKYFSTKKKRKPNTKYHHSNPNTSE